jgi:hypothetical protein
MEIPGGESRHFSGPMSVPAVALRWRACRANRALFPNWVRSVPDRFRLPITPIEVEQPPGGLDSGKLQRCRECLVN